MVGRRWAWRWVAAPIALAVSAGAAWAGAGFFGQAQTAPSTQLASVEPANAVFGAFRTELSALPDTASSEDIEASLVFVLSQSNVNDQIALEALDRLGGAATGRLQLMRAIANVRESLLNRRFRRGTAALSNGGFAVASGFSTPVTVMGGGLTSNYAQ